MKEAGQASAERARDGLSKQLCAEQESWECPIDKGSRDRLDLGKGAPRTRPEPARMPRAYNPQRTLLHHWRGTVLPRIWFPMLLSCTATIVRRSILRSCAAA